MYDFCGFVYFVGVPGFNGFCGFVASVAYVALIQNLGIIAVYKVGIITVAHPPWQFPV